MLYYRAKEICTLYKNDKSFVLIVWVAQAYVECNSLPHPDASVGAGPNLPQGRENTNSQYKDCGVGFAEARPAK